MGSSINLPRPCYLSTREWRPTWNIKLTKERFIRSEIIWIWCFFSKTELFITLYQHQLHLLHKGWNSQPYPENNYDRIISHYPFSYQTILSFWTYFDFVFIRVLEDLKKLTLSPPVPWTTGMVPYLIAYNWFKPQGSNLDGMRRMSQLFIDGFQIQWDICGIVKVFYNSSF